MACIWTVRGFEGVGIVWVGCRGFEGFLMGCGGWLVEGSSFGLMRFGVVGLRC